MASGISSDEDSAGTEPDDGLFGPKKLPATNDASPATAGLDQGTTGAQPAVLLQRGLPNSNVSPLFAELLAPLSKQVRPQPTEVSHAMDTGGAQLYPKSRKTAKRRAKKQGKGVPSPKRVNPGIDASSNGPAANPPEVAVTGSAGGGTYLAQHPFSWAAGPVSTPAGGALELKPMASQFLPGYQVGSGAHPANQQLAFLSQLLEQQQRQQQQQQQQLSQLFQKVLQPNLGLPSMGLKAVGVPGPQAGMSLRQPSGQGGAPTGAGVMEGSGLNGGHSLFSRHLCGADNGGAVQTSVVGGAPDSNLLRELLSVAQASGSLHNRPPPHS
ncbi:unnamed protein product [Ostreobium quekettii]|uniref:Uncharacterized protein n=1 Tax=Ostreobium quekettii TaxID=121088 RepID=A0A8S1JEU6_9CHLO|nr:unnamed protein product [Ostreobium quekettii]